ncbi:hypothetical protein NSB25_11100 [Acetatifactor muris]|uniref:Uncharacterized protein n=1 Tax=Acetatifactor muris TaxID=879566 RepID=A0A2K4ZGS1_9FIRM|nr:hypothetical protein [Acetatifactor muris]MCR2047830.1 hypothetical protein [Acetatifactor muris]SOY29632.1 hypothetical protein AMURIS_02353 [Acetatifactor muris]
MVPEHILQKAIAHNAVCDKLRAQGYSIQGSGNDFSKCYFTEGKAPHQKIVGYIDMKTLEIVRLD